MGDPYSRYAATADRESFSGYRTSDASTLLSRPWLSPEFLQKDILGSRFGAGISTRPEPSSNGYPPNWEDSYLTGRRDVRHGTGSAIPDILNDRPDPLRKADGIPGGVPESSVLFVDALPSDCTRREVSHLFRPFRGCKEVRLVHKEPRHSADKAKVLCFVEFIDSNQALIALEALQGYKFDNKKPDSPALQIHFAQFPFQLPSDDAPFPSQPPHDGARVSSQPPNNTRVSSQLPPHNDVYSSKLSLDSAHYSSQLPPTSAHYPSQLPPNSPDSPFRPPPSSVHFPSQLPTHSARSPFQLSPYSDDEDPVTPREQGLAVQDTEPTVAKKKFKRSSSKKAKGDINNKEKKWCIKCKQNHFGECYNFKGCYICGKTGHIGKECTSKPRLCYGCGEPGHIHALCPNGPRPEKKTNASVKKDGPP